MPKSRWKSPRDHEKGEEEEEEKTCGGWNIAVMRKMRASCTFYGINERFLESRGCIKIFNTFIQFANEGERRGFCLARWLKKWFVKWEERLYASCISVDDVSRESLKKCACHLLKKKLLIAGIDPIIWIPWIQIIQKEKLKMRRYRWYCKFIYNREIFEKEKYL